MCHCGMVVASDDSAEWMHTADAAMELLSVLGRPADFTAEFFLSCLEVRPAVRFQIFNGTFLAASNGDKSTMITSRVRRGTGLMHR